MTDSSTRRRRAAVACAAITTTVVAGTLAISPAQAQALPLVECVGTEQVTITPGATFVDRHLAITTDGRLGTCLDGAGEVASGSYGEKFSIFAGCTNLFDGFTSTRVLKWNTGDTSTYEYTGSSNVVAGQITTTATGTITSGRFAGRSAVQVIVLPTPSVLKCLTTGITETTGLTTLTIT